MAWDKVTKQVLPSSEATHLHLFRHGRVDTGGRRLAYGQTDYPLSARGREEGAALIDFACTRLPAPEGVLSSDLLRCTAIAEPLAARLGVPLERHAALREQHMGDWEGQAWEDLSARDIGLVRRYWTDYATTRPPLGESFGDLGERVAAWWADHFERLRGRRWMVVAHSGVVRVLACHLLGLPWSEGLRFTPLPGTHTWFIHAEAGACLQVLGERPTTMDAGPAGRAHAEQAGLATDGRGRPPRLAMSGSAGTGKTTLARRLAAHYDVPYIAEGMRTRIEGGLELHRLTHEAFRDLVVELWEEQVGAEEEALARRGGFVADRSPVDYLAFWLTYRFTDFQEETARFFEAALARAEHLDRIILLPWGAFPLESDGVRNSNAWAQRHYEATVEGLLHREVGYPRMAVMPSMDDFDARFAWATDLVDGRFLHLEGR